MTDVKIFQNQFEWVKAYLGHQVEFWQPFANSKSNQQYKDRFLRSQRDLAALHQTDEDCSNLATAIVNCYLNIISFRKFVDSRSTRLNNYWGYPFTQELPEYHPDTSTAGTSESKRDQASSSVDNGLPTKIKKVVKTCFDNLHKILRIFESACYRLLDSAKFIPFRSV